ncbi:Modulator of smoothened protein [Holothuria leucospilota]|uniref:Modulator of smoothened protein n=1 Tax=Holothuria leucospilota TaxID=206669 RepID=A0A9Q1BVG3_HOLLE|nr:Modulator of smoothened protein [Holothuria leucospilota]
MDSFLKGACVLYIVAIGLSGWSLIKPNWVVTEKGDLSLGLLVHCEKIHGRPMLCMMPNGPVEWLLAACLIGIGILALTVGIAMIFMSDKRPKLRRYPKYLGLFAWFLFCVAIVIFPAGFDLPLIGGQSYLLPSSAKTGMSYVLFFMGILCTVGGAALALGRMYFAMIVWRGHA